MKKSPTTNLGPFGEVLRATGPLAKANPFRFSTKYQDDESDLVYYGYRYYNASTGRWLSRDPMCSEPLRSLVNGAPEVDACSDDVAEYVFVFNRPTGSTAQNDG